MTEDLAMPAKKPAVPFKLGDWVKIRRSNRRGPIVELLIRPLDPACVQLYRVRYRAKRRPAYTVASEDELQLIPEEELNASEPAPAKVLANLAAAEQMAPRDGATAFIQSWAALESAMRRAARAARLDVDRGGASRLIGELYNGKLLDGDELIRLRASVKVRNALVRGLAVAVPGPGAVQEVAVVARRLLAANGKAPGSG
jgi:hypothetical protein